MDYPELKHIGPPLSRDRDALKILKPETVISLPGVRGPELANAIFAKG
jgi:hypothetical protein